MHNRRGASAILVVSTFRGTPWELLAILPWALSLASMRLALNKSARNRQYATVSDAQADTGGERHDMNMPVGQYLLPCLEEAMKNFDAPSIPIFSKDKEPLDVWIVSSSAIKCVFAYLCLVDPTPALLLTLRSLRRNALA